MNKNIKNYIVVSLVLILMISSFSVFSPQAYARTYVHGYHRKDGTYVHGYYRGGGSSDTYSNYTSTEPYTDPTPSYVAPTSTSSSLPTYSVQASSIAAASVVNLYKGKQVIGSTSTDDLVYVHGYYRKDGTYVRPHYRTHPNNFIQDNFSYQGISTLPPLQNYPSYIPSSDKNAVPIEHYLFHQFSNYNLTSEQLTLIKEYVSLLNINRDSSSSETEKTAIDFGISLYQNIGIDPMLSKSLAEYDWTGIMTPSCYLAQLLLENKSGARISQETLYLQKAYVISLVGAKDNNAYKIKAQNIGLAYYRSILNESVSNQDIADQISMDLMQVFQDSDNLNNIKSIISNLNQYVGYYQNTDSNVQNYLTSVTSQNALQSNIDMELYRSELVNYPSYRTIAYYYIQDGINYYITNGMTKNAAEEQAIKDLIVFF